MSNVFGVDAWTKKSKKLVFGEKTKIWAVYAGLADYQGFEVLGRLSKEFVFETLKWSNVFENVVIGGAEYPDLSQLTSPDQLADDSIFPRWLCIITENTGTSIIAICKDGEGEKFFEATKGYSVKPRKSIRW